MAILQSRIDEIRYLRKSHLEEESKIIGGYFHDLIRQYGVDCHYYKIKIPQYDIFKPILDENNLLIQAYGQDSHPDYSISADMITYMEVENDVLDLNKFGVFQNQNVNFYFDATDFACSLAYKLGQLKEYKIEEQRFEIEVPEMISDYVEYDINGDGMIVVTSFMSSTVKDYDVPEAYNLSTVSSWIKIDYYDSESHDLISSTTVNDISDLWKYDIRQERMYLSDDLFPFGIGYGVPEYYHSDILSGKFAVKLQPYELNKEYTVMCRPYEHGDVDISFPVNDTIYKSFNHTIGTKEYVDQILFLTYKVVKVKVGGEYKCILKGKLHGAILFHDLSKIGKYTEMINPEVGDIVTIDFPDENNRMQYEITESNDKNLGNDGINPLLHKYIWKCKAKRYVNSGEDFMEVNEANERVQERFDYNMNNEEAIDKQIGLYDETDNDAVYGGYERPYESHDIKKADIKKDKLEFHENDKIEFVDDGSYIEIHLFSDTSRLVTDGYELYFIDKNNYGKQLTLVEEKRTITQSLVPTGIQYLKATDDALYFNNFDDCVQQICCDDETLTDREIEICLNSLIDTTHGTTNNERGNFYYKFRNSNTVLMSLNDHLYCRFGNKEHKMIKIA